MNALCNNQHIIKTFFTEKKGRTSIRKKAAEFSLYFEQQIAEGLPIKREIISQADTGVIVKDRLHNTKRKCIMFGSNNYLGLANHKQLLSKINDYIKDAGVGLGGPPFLNGTTSLHNTLEKRLAKFKNYQDSMLFSSGFSANYGILTALGNKGDIIILDKLSHSSLIEGARASSSDYITFQHNDCQSLEYHLKIHNSKSNKIVVVEGVYSMDGDIAPLNKIISVCKKYNAFLIVDDAHGTGVLGKHGKGTAEHFNIHSGIDLTIGTFSKAFASSGGFVTGDKELIDYLRFYSKSYFFSAAMPPLHIAQILAALDIMEENNDLIKKLHTNVSLLKRGLKKEGFSVSSDSAIIPLYVKEKCDIRRLARHIFEDGIFVNHIEYPAVPADRQRFRISVMASHTKNDITALITILTKYKKYFI